MKHIYLFVALALCISTTYSQEPFITTWQVGPPASSSYLITIPTNPDLQYNYSLQLNNDAIINNIAGNYSIPVSTPGPHTIKIWGQFPAIDFSQPAIEPSALKLQSIEQWGDIQWQSMKGAFSGCQYMVLNATDAPDLSQVTDMSTMFNMCGSMNSSIDHWNVSTITNMQETFFGTTSFNHSINSWDVSNVTNMRFMFGYSGYNLPLDNWDVSNVTTMLGMFANSPSFNQSLNAWDVSSVVDMSSMFMNASVFNQPIDAWDVSNVETMANTFFQAYAFNQPINTWNVTNVTKMEAMSAHATSFNQPLNNWNVSNVTRMTNMFTDASSFNQPLGNWNIGNVTEMRFMFSNAVSFDQNIDSWDVSNVTDLSGIFYGASAFNQPVNSWDVSSANNIGNIFSYATAFNQPLNNWDVSNVQLMDGTFAFATSFNQPLENWDVSNVETMLVMFLEATAFNQPLSAWSFAEDVNFIGFLHNSGVDVVNYDALLTKFQQLSYQQKFLGASGLQYCNVAAHDYLVNDLGWTIAGDALSADCSFSTNENTVASIMVYPVPASNLISIETAVNIVSTEIYDIAAKKIFSQENSQKLLDISQLASGQYFLKIHTDSEVVVKRFIKR